MKHLKLKLNSNTEIVTSAIIEKLYQLVSNNTLDSSSSLSGNLQSPHAYEDAVSYLTSNYPNLAINITDGNYIRFKDSTVESICASKWGDNIGLTKTNAYSVTKLSGYFSQNSTITSFDELTKFTNLTSLADNEFYNCTKLKTISLDNIKQINGSVFKNCTSLISVGNLSNATLLGDNTFSSCTSLLSIGDLTNITSIGSSSFSGCTSLISIGDLSNVITIDWGAFSSCTNLETVGDLSNVVRFLNSRAFASDIKLKSVNLSSNCTTIELLAFLNCSSLVSVGDTSAVNSIALLAFLNCSSLVSIDLKALTDILSNTFSGCTALTTLLNLDNIKTIGNSAFEGCTKLPSITLSSNCTAIGDTAFLNNTSLTTVSGTSGLTKIGTRAFCNDILLSSIDISNVTSIGNNAFLGCSVLNNITFSENLERIGNQALSGTLWETEWYGKQADGLIRIGKVLYKYKGTMTDTSITIDNDIVSLSSYCFDLLKNLTTVVLNSSLKELGDNAFNYCTNLKSINLSNVEIISYAAFNNCTALTIDVDLPKLTSLSAKSFALCPISSIHLYNISILSQQSLYNCTSLRYIRIDADKVLTLEDSAIYGTTCNIYVLDTLVDSYKTASGWSSYASRIKSLTLFATDFPNG